ncbi:MAG: hypothetical protein WAK48_26200, partial [Candidatus Acidiferrum sp.]
MKSLSGVLLGLPLSTCTFSLRIQPSTQVFLPGASNPEAALRGLPSPTAPVLRYVPRSTIKMEQLLGEEDK